MHAAGLKHVDGNHGVVVENERMVGLDEAHAAHVGREVVDIVGILGRLESDVGVAQITQNELVAELMLVITTVRIGDSGKGMIRRIMMYVDTGRVYCILYTLHGDQRDD